MGVVVAATHLQLEQTVALKFFRGDLRHGWASRCCASCARRAPPRRLKSEHVARVLDVGVTDDGTPYMVMEYLEGEGLEQVRRRRGPLPIASAVEYALQACEALAEAHARGIVHRDLKPSNLFLVERSPGWRTDQGPRFRHLESVAGAGVEHHDQPELGDGLALLHVARAVPVGGRASTIAATSGRWARRCTRCSRGAPPFDPSLPLLALAESIVKKEPPSLRELRPDIPQELSDVDRPLHGEGSRAALSQRGGAGDLAAAVRAGSRERDRRAGRGHHAGARAARARSAAPRDTAAARRGAGRRPGEGDPTMGSRARSGRSSASPARFRRRATASATPPPPAPSILGSTGTPSSLITGGVPVAALVPIDRLPGDETGGARAVATEDVGGGDHRLPAGVRGRGDGRAARDAARRALRLDHDRRARSDGRAGDAVRRAAGVSWLVRVTPAAAQIMIDGALVAGNPFRGRFPGGVHQIQAFARRLRAQGAADLAGDRCGRRAEPGSADARAVERGGSRDAAHGAGAHAAAGSGRAVATAAVAVAVLVAAGAGRCHRPARFAAGGLGDASDPRPAHARRRRSARRTPPHAPHRDPEPVQESMIKTSARIGQALPSLLACGLVLGLGVA